jgi:hypothetical protein
MDWKQEFKRSSNEAPLSELVQRWLKAYRLEDKMKELDVIQAWPEMMGIAVANRTKKIAIRKKILYLTIDSSVMRDELAHGKSIIIQRVNEKAGFEIIQDIWFE